MARHKGNIAEKVKLLPKPSKRAAVPVKKSNIISHPKDPSRMFGMAGYFLVRTDDNVSLVLKHQKGKRKSKLVAEFSKSALGPYVIKFYDPNVQKAFEKRLDVERILERKKKKGGSPGI